jgi:hypothetical protein
VGRGVARGRRGVGKWHDNLKQQGPKSSTMNILDGEVTHLLTSIYIYIIPQSTKTFFKIN